MVQQIRSQEEWKDIASIEQAAIDLEASNLLSDHANNLVELEHDGGISSNSKYNPTISSLAPASQITPPPHRHLRRQVVVVTTDVDLIVEDGSGSTIAEAVLPGLPTAPTAVSLPIGTLTLPALASGPPVISLPVEDLNTQNLSPTATPSLSIQIPDSSSQVVVSSPPTPNPESSFTSLPLSTSSASGSSHLPSAAPSTVAPNSTTSITSLVSSSSILAHSSNSTTTTTTPTTTTPSTLVTSTSNTGSKSSEISSISSLSPSSTGLSATTTEGAGGFGVGSGTATSAAPSATSSSAGAGAAAASSATPTYVPVVGGVLGGLAGLALLLLAALFLLRWYKRRERAAGRLQDDDDERGVPSTSHSAAPMAQNSAAPWGAAALAPLIRRIRPYSTATAATTDTGPSERGFQKVSGRKIESVLVSGGDGYGGRGPGAGNLSGQSFYRDSYGTYGGGESKNSSMIVGPASPRKSAATSDYTDMSGIAGPSNLARGLDKEVVTMRPGPARQPVTSPAYQLSQQSLGNQEVPSSEYEYPPTADEQLRTPDPLGRSRPSHDGSRGSKFAEDLT